MKCLLLLMLLTAVFQVTYFKFTAYFVMQVIPHVISRKKS